ncbi:lymphocyte cytosolic protein 2-like [Phymastichus coffea]|uniref:lymphocyte cytosolic protein 2-like n=1 Tax=Phymastichus coffea TaxID=108790 RepID=UPI00273B518F|nr:lymphocyte cytosolic protein 2-like [Phymastichus coffea]
MSKASRIKALDDISTWQNPRVVALLRNSGLDEACWKAVEKRRIDGDELLHLTEGKLTLWKSDLSKPLIRTLWTFVEELKKCPESYVEDEQQPAEPEPAEPEPAAVGQATLVIEQPSTATQQQQQQTETESDTGWDTDFEDNVDGQSNCDLRSNLGMLRESDRSQPVDGGARAYANCETTYANVGYAQDTPAELSRQGKSLAEKLKEQLLLRGASLEAPLSAGAKPTVAPKPEGLAKRSREDVVLRRTEPRTSFLHKKAHGANAVPKKMTVAPPAQPTPKRSSNNNNNDESLRNLPKPPVSIRSFDLVANLPTTRPPDDSDDDDDEEEDYEAFDEQIVEQHQRDSLMSRTDSGQSLSSPDRNSIGSAYHPTSSISHDEDDHVYDIYESITETPEEKGRDYKSQSNLKNLVNPPPLPLKPPPNNTMLHNQLNKAYSKSERSLDKKSATLPHSGSNLSLNNAARPLPPPPEHRDTYYERPWFHNLTREQANLLIEDQCTYHNAPDGYFLMRPSTSNPNNPLTLVLWCKDRVYNVPVRRRPDNRYSLGKAKLDEQSFESVDDIVPYYKKEKLVLYTGGVQTGSTKLSDTPPKEKLNISF